MRKQSDPVMMRRDRQPRPTGPAETDPARRKPSICFVSPNNYAVLSGRDDLTHIGGSEIQQPMIARELLRRGYKTSFVVFDHGQPDGIEHDGVSVFKMCALDDGIPIVRFVYPRWTSLWSALTRADADVYYQMNAGTETGQTAMWCRRHGRRFLYSIASDADCRRSLPALRRRRERVLYRYGLRRADRIISQTYTQEALLRDAFDLDSVVIRSCSRDVFDGRFTPRTPEDLERPRFLWIGRFSREKRLELLLDLAEALPETTYDIIGAANMADRYAHDLSRRAATLPNVVLHGRLPHDAMSAFYRKATALVCTSAFEGFPNTFMEAWCHGTPVVSTVDPDGIIQAQRIGLVPSEPEQLPTVARDLLRSTQEWSACSTRARRYYENHHTVRATVDGLAPLLEEHA